jgi:hypothetical protein
MIGHGREKTGSRSAAARLRCARISCAHTARTIGPVRPVAFIEYNGGLKINAALLSVVLHE